MASGYPRVFRFRPAPRSTSRRRAPTPTPARRAPRGGRCRRRWTRSPAGQIAYVRAGTYSQNLVMTRAGTASGADHDPQLPRRGSGAGSGYRSDGQHAAADRLVARPSSASRGSSSRARRGRRRRTCTRGATRTTSSCPTARTATRSGRGSSASAPPAHPDHRLLHPRQRRLAADPARPQHLHRGRAPRDRRTV